MAWLLIGVGASVALGWVYSSVTEKEPSPQLFLLNIYSIEYILLFAARLRGVRIKFSHYRWI